MEVDQMAGKSGKAVLIDFQVKPMWHRDDRKAKT